MPKKALKAICFLLLVVSVLPVQAGGSGGRRSTVRSSSSPKAQVVRSASRSRTRVSTSRGRSYSYRSPRGYRYYRNPYRYYSPRYYYYGYPYYWNYAFGLGYPYYGALSHAYYYPRPYYAAPVGSVKLKVKPKKAQVFVDGEAVGKAGLYDGWPGTLYLEKGRHELIVYSEGRKTVRREIDVLPNSRQKLVIAMEPGIAEPADKVSLVSKTRERERRDLYDRYSKDRNPGPEQNRRETRISPPKAAPGAVDRELDMRLEGGRLRLQVFPGDAVIYIDGRFMAKASDLDRRGNRIVLDPGQHELEVFMPGREPLKRTIEIKPGKTTDLKLDLDEKQ